MRIATAIALVACLALGGCFEGKRVHPDRRATRVPKVYLGRPVLQVRSGLRVPPDPLDLRVLLDPLLLRQNQNSAAPSGAA